MARRENKGSNRQKAFAFLDINPGRTRTDCLETMMVDLKIGLVYAKTLYQNWRKLRKETGELTKVFTIRDHKDGATVDPYVFTKHIPNPSKKMARTEASAVIDYIKELKVRMEKASKL